MSMEPKTVDNAPKTIDNLGDDVSLKYIEGQKALEENPLQEAYVGELATVLSQSPYQTEWGAFQQHYNTHSQHEPWANFLPPPGFFSSMKRLFTHQLIPSMGTAEKQEALLEKLEKIQRKKKRKNRDAHDFSEEDNKQERKNKGAHDFSEEEQKNKIAALLHLIQSLDQDLGLVNGLRNQYHKG